MTTSTGSSGSGTGRKPLREAWKTCGHVTGYGQMIIYVDLDCPAGSWIRGFRMCCKDDCGAACLHYAKSRDVAGDARRPP